MHSFESEFPIVVSELFPDADFNNIYIQNLSDELDIYIGNEDVTIGNYGMKLVPLSTMYLPFIDISQNQNISIIGSPGAKFSVFGWYGIHPVFNTSN